MHILTQTATREPILDNMPTGKKGSFFWGGGGGGGGGVALKRQKMKLAKTWTRQCSGSHAVRCFLLVADVITPTC